MNIIMNLLSRLILSLLLSFNAYAAEQLQLNSLQFVNPWIAEAPPGANVMAGYMEIINPTSHPIDITSINSSSFKTIEMHQSKESNGFSKMLPQKKLSIPSNGKLILKSGSYHLMLIKPIKWFKQGDKVKLNITLSDNSILPLDIHIKKTASRAMKCAAGRCGGK